MNDEGESFGQLRHEWFKRCFELSCKYPTNSVEHCFWWSLRYELNDRECIHEWATNPEQALARWLEYLWFRIDQLVVEA